MKINIKSSNILAILVCILEKKLLRNDRSSEQPIGSKSVSAYTEYSAKNGRISTYLEVSVSEYFLKNKLTNIFKPMTRRCRFRFDFRFGYDFRNVMIVM